MRYTAQSSAALLCAFLSCATGTRLAAETYTAGSIEIVNPWARATPKGATVGGGYMSITNKGTEADRLLGGSSPVAAKLEVHQMSMSNGVMTMRPVPGGLEIKPGQTVVLDPDSFHVMIMGLKQPLTQGEHVEATLDFAKAGKVEVEYVVGSVGARGPENAAAPTMQKPAMPGMQMDHTH
jgi:periplasmic copper chaperone A